MYKIDISRALIKNNNFNSGKLTHTRVTIQILWEIILNLTINYKMLELN